MAPKHTAEVPCSVPYGKNMYVCCISCVQVLMAVSSRLMNQRFILKSVLNRNTWNKVNILISWQNYCEEAHRNLCLQILTVQFSHSVVSDSLRPHGLQHTRLPCPLPIPGAYSDSCPSINDAIQPSHPLSSSFFSHLQSFPASDSFPRIRSSHQVTKILEFQLQHQSL